MEMTGNDSTKWASKCDAQIAKSPKQQKMTVILERLAVTRDLNAVSEKQTPAAKWKFDAEFLFVAKKKDQTSFFMTENW